jgi:hypothetical protein
VIVLASIAVCYAISDASYSTTYAEPGQAAGSIQGQPAANALLQRFSGGGPGNTMQINPTLPQRIMSVGSAAHSGTQVWFHVNKNFAGAFNTMPFSPKLTVAAGKPSTGAPADRIRGGVWFYGISPAADGTRLEMDIGNSQGSDRGNNVFVDNVDANGMRLRTFAVSSGGNVTIFDHITRQAWHHFEFECRYADGAGNTRCAYKLDGISGAGFNPADGTYESFESLNQNRTAPGADQHDRMFFRSTFLASALGGANGAGPFTNDEPQGLYFDDMSYEVYNSANPQVVFDSYLTSFEQYSAPANKDQCKDGGWATFNPNRPAGAFKNQGDCIQFVNTGK